MRVPSLSGHKPNSNITTWKIANKKDMRYIVDIPKQTSVLLLEGLPDTEQSIKLSNGLSAPGAKNIITMPKITHTIEKMT